MFQYEFMQRAFWAGGLISLIAPILGVYLVLRRQSLMSDTLSHVSMAGVALGTVLHANPVIFGFLFAVLGGMTIEWLRRTYKTYSEVPVAIIMTSGLALAMVLMNMKTNLNKSFSSYLFGSIVAVSPSQLMIIAAVTLIGLIFFILLRRPLYSLTFEEDTAAVSGVRVKLLSFAFAVMTGMIVAAAMPIVGVLLVSSMIVLPSAFALRFAGGFVSASILSVATGLTGVFSGLTASYYTDTPPGGTIALILLMILLVGIGFQRVIQQVRNRRKGKAQTILLERTKQTIEEGVFK
ncbi:iron chelate uptake ABC transporter family permease subunit [Paenibacillus sp. HJL G12]|uniref:Iron chelate uptake ABC transporter family permease subunit n=2 Tax=Paenibacillus dendrobii TaxID=2691084 RepID=A0A7X3LH61_9BACL|nr:metal ABC transporter permease [Paenibacillus dendrobii]MWV43223.1 iron chelate uptake ABC transporter family permease subunit [Paenibacillus dendrobii]